MLRTERLKSSDLVEGARDEFLSSETGIDTHETDQVNFSQNFFNGRQWCMGIQGHSRTHSGLPNGTECSVQVNARLRVNRENVGAQICKMSDVPVGRLNHEVHIEGFLGMTADGSNDGHAVTDVGDEHAVHDINVVPIGVTVVYHGHVAGQVSKVSGEQRGGDKVCHGVNVAWLNRMPEYCGMSLSTPQDNNVDRTGAVVVGLTGGIGVGKSVVAQILRTLGHPVFDADAAARELYDKDASLLQAVADRFGPGVLGADGRLNRTVLAALVFNDPNALADLNAMVHPAVAKAFLSWKSSVERNGALVVFREAAILFESGSNADCDWVWAVSAPWSLRLQRVQNRNGWSVDEVEVRAGHQWPAEKVMARADKVILNDGSTALVPLVLSLLDELF